MGTSSGKAALRSIRKRIQSILNQEEISPSDYIVLFNALRDLQEMLDVSQKDPRTSEMSQCLSVFEWCALFNKIYQGPQHMREVIFQKRKITMNNEEAVRSMNQYLENNFKVDETFIKLFPGCICLLQSPVNQKDLKEQVAYCKLIQCLPDIEACRDDAFETIKNSFMKCFESDRCQYFQLYHHIKILLDERLNHLDHNPLNEYDVLCDLIKELKDIDFGDPQTGRGRLPLYQRKNPAHMDLVEQMSRYLSPDLTVPDSIFETFPEIVDQCRTYYEKNNKTALLEIVAKVKLYDQLEIFEARADGLSDSGLSQ